MIAWGKVNFLTLDFVEWVGSDLREEMKTMIEESDFAKEVNSRQQGKHVVQIEKIKFQFKTG